MKTTLNFICRPYTSADLESILSLFHNTVHAINIKDYSPQQVSAWASSALNKERWAQLLLEHYTYVAEYDSNIIGFGDITHKGSLKHIYVDKDFQGYGVASLLLQAIEEKAQELGFTEIVTESSITAKPFFEKRGFILVQQQEKMTYGKSFINFIMKRTINK